MWLIKVNVLLDLVVAVDSTVISTRLSRRSVLEISKKSGCHVAHVALLHFSSVSRDFLTLLADAMLAKVF